MNIRTLRNLLHRSPWAVSRELFEEPPTISGSDGAYRVMWKTGVCNYFRASEEVVDHLIVVYAAQKGDAEIVTRFQTLRESLAAAV